ncbi:MAG: GNAT family N-acetyltransferase [Muribaculaceae bacterium]|nr:GNAT family N-acetyltransferase [Muribaculaceae bacterium]
MKAIIPPVDVDLLKTELTPQRLLRKTNKADNEIYIVDSHTAPHVMREIGRLREIAFRASGGGTGKECDIDEFDTMDPPCRQLLVWNPDSSEIIGAYRFITGPDIRIVNGVPRIATAHMFHFSDCFIHEYLPYTIELGRSFVRLEYQSTRVGSKAIYALDNLWDGLGALTVVYPQMRYLFGKMTMYPTYDRDCRNLLLGFLNLYFPDPDCLVRPIEPLQGTAGDDPSLSQFFLGNDFKEDYRRLNAFIRQHGINIPPLVNAYMSLSPTMRMCGTAINHEFGEVEESSIFFSIDEITDEKKNRHIQSYINKK